MTKKELLSIMRLLSSLESWARALRQPFPEYLERNISQVIDALEREITS